MFFCISLSQVITCLTSTIDSLRFLCLICFRRGRERRGQLQRDFDNRFIYTVEGTGISVQASW
jgi:hypothetical protein